MATEAPSSSTVQEWLECRLVDVISTAWVEVQVLAEGIVAVSFPATGPSFMLITTIVDVTKAMDLWGMSEVFTTSTVEDDERYLQMFFDTGDWVQRLRIEIEAMLGVNAI